MKNMKKVTTFEEITRASNLKKIFFIDGHGIDTELTGIELLNFRFFEIINFINTGTLYVTKKYEE